MTYAYKKKLGIAFFVLIFTINSTAQAVLFDGAIKNLVNAASAETRKVLREDVYPQTTRLIKETLYPNIEHLIENKIFPHMVQLIEETIYPKIEQVIEEKVYPQATRLLEEKIYPKVECLIEEKIYPQAVQLLEEKVYPKVECLVDTMIEEKLYPRTVCLIKQLAVALTGTAICTAGVWLFVAQCEKNAIFVDKKRMSTSALLLALGGSMVKFSDRIAKRL